MAKRIHHEDNPDLPALHTPQAGIGNGFLAQWHGVPGFHPIRPQENGS
jgi:hypothetical protein